MYTIYLHEPTTKVGYKINSFKTKFLNICNTHVQDERALAFAFILYDFENPEIAKILKDIEYWNCLNQVAGHYLTVFSILQPLRTSPSNFNKNKDFDENLNNSNRIILSEYFHSEFDSKMPSILFFQVSKNQIIDSLLCQITYTSVDDAFKEIKAILSTAVNSLKHVEPQYRNNSQEIFNLITGGLSERREKLLYIKSIKILKSASEIIILVSKIYQILAR
ncbi:hypothetical protein KC734_07655 [candidate division KSB1 bacterium]|nr:hypothetical protein [candidate division KSB1 bacterium]